MPKQYEEIKAKNMAQGMPKQAAETKAAKIYNADRKPGTPPVTNKPDKKY